MLSVITAYNATTPEAKKQLEQVIINAGCAPINVTTLSEAVAQLREKQPALLVVGQEFEHGSIVELIPIFKHLQRDLKIILLADSASEGFLRQARAEGIFYHALEPTDEEDCQELKLVLECAKEAIAKKRAPFWQRLSPALRV